MIVWQPQGTGGATYNRLVRKSFNKHSQCDVGVKYLEVGAQASVRSSRCQSRERIGCLCVWLTNERGGNLDTEVEEGMRPPGLNKFGGNKGRNHMKRKGRRPRLKANATHGVVQPP